MDILNSPKTPVFSLDIETTGLDHKDNRILTVGLSGEKYEQEFFQKGIIPENSRPDKIIPRVLAAHVRDGAGDFARKQNTKGAFDEYKKRFESKTMSSLDDTFNVLTMNLKNKAGVFLVQNLNFESEAFGEARNKLGDQNLSDNTRSRFLSNIFGVDPELSKNSKKMIPQDNRIISARKDFDSAANIFKQTGDFSQETITNFKGTLAKASSSLESTLNNVVKENMDKGFSTAIDLMDITKLYTSKLALNDGIAPGYLSTGLSVDYLAKELLGTPEKHTALSDARQQRKIFNILTDRIDKINKSGVLSAKDLEYGENLMNSDVHERTFMSNIQNRLTEAQKKKGTLSEGKVASIISQSLENYSTIPEKANFNRLAFAEDIRKTYLKNPSEAFAKITEIKDQDLLPDIKALAAPDESPLLRKGGMARNSKVLMGLTALGVVAMVGSNNRQSKKEELTSYDDLYENVYLGQEYANWQERNNSHKMIY